MPWEVDRSPHYEVAEEIRVMNAEIAAFGCDFDDWPGPSKPTPPTIQYDPELDGPRPDG